MRLTPSLQFERSLSIVRVTLKIEFDSFLPCERTMACTVGGVRRCQSEGTVEASSSRARPKTEAELEKADVATSAFRSTLTHTTETTTPIVPVLEAPPAPIVRHHEVSRHRGILPTFSMLLCQALLMEHDMDLTDIGRWSQRILELFEF